MLYAELLEKTWKEKMDEWSKRPKGERERLPESFSFRLQNTDIGLMLIWNL